MKKLITWLSFLTVLGSLGVWLYYIVNWGITLSQISSFHDKHIVAPSALMNKSFDCQFGALISVAIFIGLSQLFLIVKKRRGK